MGEPLGNPKTTQARELYLKTWIYIELFMFKLESFARAIMPRRFPRTCPVCGRPHLKNLSTHLLKVHELSSEERRPYLKQTQVSSWQPHVDKPRNMAMSCMKIEKPGEKRVSQCEHSPPAKRPRTTARTTTSLATNPYPDFNFAINSHFWLWVLHKVEKPILFNKF